MLSKSCWFHKKKSSSWRIWRFFHTVAKLDLFKKNSPLTRSSGSGGSADGDKVGGGELLSNFLNSGFSSRLLFKTFPFFLELSWCDFDDSEKKYHICECVSDFTWNHFWQFWSLKDFYFDNSTSSEFWFFRFFFFFKPELLPIQHWNSDFQKCQNGCF